MRYFQIFILLLLMMACRQASRPSVYLAQRQALPPLTFRSMEDTLHLDPSFQRQFHYQKEYRQPIDARWINFGLGGWDAGFDGAQFYNDANFLHTVFWYNADFDYSGFHRKQIDRDRTAITTFVLAQFRDRASFREAIFDQPADIGLVQFMGTTVFENARFNSYVSFTNSKWADAALFDRTQFRKAAYFNLDSFSYCDFRGAQFDTLADFAYAQFRAKAIFGAHDPLTTGLPDTATTTFNADVSFLEADFREGVQFYKASFRGRVDFTNTRFSNNAIFRSVDLSSGSRLDFTGAVLPDTLDFSAVNHIPDDIDLTTANFTDPTHFDSAGRLPYRKHVIYLYKSDISRFHLDYAHFKLLTDSTLFVDSTLDLRRTGITEDDADGMYEALLNNFKSRGQNESYKLLDIEYQKFKWQYGWASPLAWLPERWWNFGYNKEYIFYWTGVFLLLFTCITFFILDYLNTRVYAMKNVPPLGRPFDRHSAVYVRNLGKRLWYAFVYSANIFFRLTLKIEELHYNKFWATLYVMLMYTLGLVCLAYMANFVLQK
jgi:uncharacterized protein YjbI with pentapeptide repeats